MFSNFEILSFLCVPYIPLNVTYHTSWKTQNHILGWCFLFLLFVFACLHCICVFWCCMVLSDNTLYSIMKHSFSWHVAHLWCVMGKLTYSNREWKGEFFKWHAMQDIKINIYQYCIAQCVTYIHSNWMPSLIGPDITQITFTCAQRRENLWCSQLPTSTVTPVLKKSYKIKKF